MSGYRITVFTPTYNRAYVIEKLYRSLRAQSYTNFEWLVVDDGSTDETALLFSDWMQRDNRFLIRYYKKENGGKHRAVNHGLELAEGEIFFVVDSDDSLTPDALYKINQWFSELPKDRSVSGITANKGYSADKTPNNLFDGPYLDKPLLAMNTYVEHGKLVLSGERAMAFYTDVHRKYAYPEFGGENFVTEAVVYNRMSKDGHKMRFFNDIIWIYEYLEDGLTRSGSKLFINNPRGYGLWLREKADFEGISLLNRLKMYYTFTCDLSPYYDTKLIAESIGAPQWIVRGIIAGRNLLKR